MTQGYLWAPFAYIDPTPSLEFRSEFTINDGDHALLLCLFTGLHNQNKECKVSAVPKKVSTVEGIRVVPKSVLLSAKRAYVRSHSIAEEVTHLSCRFSAHISGLSTSYEISKWHPAPSGSRAKTFTLTKTERKALETGCPALLELIEDKGSKASGSWGRSKLELLAERAMKLGQCPTPSLESMYSGVLSNEGSRNLEDFSVEGSFAPVCLIWDHQVLVEIATVEDYERLDSALKADNPLQLMVEMSSLDVEIIQIEARQIRFRSKQKSTPRPEFLFASGLWTLKDSERLLDQEHLRFEFLEAIDAERIRFESLKRKFEAPSKEFRPLRTPIPESVRIFVWRRDGGRCVGCGSQENLEYDHIIPFSQGGSSTERNIQLLCMPCNRRKSDKV